MTLVFLSIHTFAVEDIRRTLLPRTLAAAAPAARIATPLGIILHSQIVGYSPLLVNNPCSKFLGLDVEFTLLNLNRSTAPWFAVKQQLLPPSFLAFSKYLRR